MPHLLFGAGNEYTRKSIKGSSSLALTTCSQMWATTVKQACDTRKRLCDRAQEPFGSPQGEYSFRPDSGKKSKLGQVFKEREGVYLGCAKAWVGNGMVWALSNISANVHGNAR